MLFTERWKWNNNRASSQSSVDETGQSEERAEKRKAKSEKRTPLGEIEEEKESPEPVEDETGVEGQWQL